MAWQHLLLHLAGSADFHLVFPFSRQACGCDNCMHGFMVPTHASQGPCGGWRWMPRCAPLRPTSGPGARARSRRPSAQANPPAGCALGALPVSRFQEDASKATRLTCLGLLVCRTAQHTVQLGNAVRMTRHCAVLP